MKKKLKYDISMTTTSLIVTIGFISLGLYDLAVVMIYDNVSISVSRFLINTGFDAPFVTLVIGVVIGHLFTLPKLVKSKEVELQDPVKPKDLE